MNTHTSRSSFVRCIATAVLCTFAVGMFSDFTYAASIGTPEVCAPLALSLPAQLGKVVEQYTGTTKEHVIVIQDVHCNPEVQKKMSTIIAHAKKIYGNMLTVVGIEGTRTGEINTQILRAIPDAALRRVVTEHFVRRGEISGGELYTIEAQDDVRAYGVEDAALYQKDFAAFCASLGYRTQVVHAIETMMQGIDVAKQYVYTNEALRIEDMMKAYEAGKMTLEEYIQRMQNATEEMQNAECKMHNEEKRREMQNAECKMHNEEKSTLSVTENGGMRIETVRGKSKEYTHNIVARLTSCPTCNTCNTCKIRREQIANFLRMQELNKALDMQAISAETQYVLTYITPTLTQPERAMLAARRSEGSEAFYAYLNTLLRAKHVALTNQFPHLQHYYTYMECVARVDDVRLMQEIEMCSNTLRAHALRERSDGTRICYAEHYLKLMKKYMLNEASHADVEEWRNGREQFFSVMQHLEQYAMSERYFSQYQAMLRSADRVMEQFYRYAARRNEVMINNLLDASRSHKGTVSVCVVGGFHRQGLANVLKSKGISYTIVMPAIEKKCDNRLFLRRVQKQLSIKDKKLKIKNTISKTKELASISDTSPNANVEYQPFEIQDALMVETGFQSGELTARVLTNVYEQLRTQHGEDSDFMAYVETFVRAYISRLPDTGEQRAVRAFFAHVTPQRRSSGVHAVSPFVRGMMCMSPVILPSPLRHEMSIMRAAEYVWHQQFTTVDDMVRHIDEVAVIDARDMEADEAALLRIITAALPDGWTCRCVRMAHFAGVISVQRTDDEQAADVYVTEEMIQLLTDLKKDLFDGERDGDERFQQLVRDIIHNARLQAGIWEGDEEIGMQNFGGDGVEFAVEQGGAQQRVLYEMITAYSFLKRREEECKDEDEGAFLEKIERMMKERRRLARWMGALTGLTMSETEQTQKIEAMLPTLTTRYHAVIQELEEEIAMMQQQLEGRQRYEEWLQQQKETLYVHARERRKHYAELTEQIEQEYKKQEHERRLNIATQLTWVRIVRAAEAWDTQLVQTRMDLCMSIQAATHTEERGARMQEFDTQIDDVFEGIVLPEIVRGRRRVWSVCRMIEISVAEGIYGAMLAQRQRMREIMCATIDDATVYVLRSFDGAIQGYHVGSMLKQWDDVDHFYCEAVDVHDLHSMCTAMHRMVERSDTSIETFTALIQAMAGDIPAEHRTRETVKTVQDLFEHHRDVLVRFLKKMPDRDNMFPYYIRCLFIIAHVANDAEHIFVQDNSPFVMVVTDDDGVLVVNLALQKQQWRASPSDFREDQWYKMTVSRHRQYCMLGSMMKSDTPQMNDVLTMQPFEMRQIYPASPDEVKQLKEAGIEDLGMEPTTLELGEDTHQTIVGFREKKGAAYRRKVVRVVNFSAAEQTVSVRNIFRERFFNSIFYVCGFRVNGNPTILTYPIEGRHVKQHVSLTVPGHGYLDVSLEGKADYLQRIRTSMQGSLQKAGYTVRAIVPGFVFGRGEITTCAVMVKPGAATQEGDAVLDGHEVFVIAHALRIDAMAGSNVPDNVYFNFLHVLPYQGEGLFLVEMTAGVDPAIIAGRDSKRKRTRILCTPDGLSQFLVSLRKPKGTERDGDIIPFYTMRVTPIAATPLGLEGSEESLELMEWKARVKEQVTRKRDALQMQAEERKKIGDILETVHNETGIAIDDIMALLLPVRRRSHHRRRQVGADMARRVDVAVPCVKVGEGRSSSGSEEGERVLRSTEELEGELRILCAQWKEQRERREGARASVKDERQEQAARRIAGMRALRHLLSEQRRHTRERDEESDTAAASSSGNSHPPSAAESPRGEGDVHAEDGVVVSEQTREIMDEALRRFEALFADDERIRAAIEYAREQALSKDAVLELEHTIMEQMSTLFESSTPASLVSPEDIYSALRIVRLYIRDADMSLVPAVLKKRMHTYHAVPVATIIDELQDTLKGYDDLGTELKDTLSVADVERIERDLTAYYREHPSHRLQLWRMAYIFLLFLDLHLALVRQEEEHQRLSSRLGSGHSTALSNALRGFTGLAHAFERMLDMNFVHNVQGLYEYIGARISGVPFIAEGVMSTVVDIFQTTFSIVFSSIDDVIAIIIETDETGHDRAIIFSGFMRFARSLHGMLRAELHDEGPAQERWTHLMTYLRIQEESTRDFRTQHGAEPKYRNNPAQLWDDAHAAALAGEGEGAAELRALNALFPLIEELWRVEREVTRKRKSWDRDKNERVQKILEAMRPLWKIVRRRDDSSDVQTDALIRFAEKLGAYYVPEERAHAAETPHTPVASQERRLRTPRKPLCFYRGERSVVNAAHEAWSADATTTDDVVGYIEENREKLEVHDTVMSVDERAVMTTMRQTLPSGWHCVYVDMGPFVGIIPFREEDSDEVDVYVTRGMVAFLAEIQNDLFDEGAELQALIQELWTHARLQVRLFDEDEETAAENFFGDGDIFPYENAGARQKAMYDMVDAYHWLKQQEERYDDEGILEIVDDVIRETTRVKRLMVLLIARDGMGEAGIRRKVAQIFPRLTAGYTELQQELAENTGYGVESLEMLEHALSTCSGDALVYRQARKRAKGYEEILRQIQQEHAAGSYPRLSFQTRVVWSHLLPMSIEWDRRLLRVRRELEATARSVTAEDSEKVVAVMDGRIQGLWGDVITHTHGWQLEKVLRRDEAAALEQEMGTWVSNVFYRFGCEMKRKAGGDIDDDDEFNMVARKLREWGKTPQPGLTQLLKRKPRVPADVPSFAHAFLEVVTRAEEPAHILIEEGKPFVCVAQSDGSLLIVNCSDDAAVLSNLDMPDIDDESWYTMTASRNRKCLIQGRMIHDRDRYTTVLIMQPFEVRRLVPVPEEQMGRIRALEIDTGLGKRRIETFTPYMLAITDASDDSAFPDGDASVFAVLDEERDTTERSFYVINPGDREQRVTLHELRSDDRLYLCQSEVFPPEEYENPKAHMLFYGTQGVTKTVRAKGCMRINIIGAIPESTQRIIEGVATEHTFMVDGIVVESNPHTTVNVLLDYICTVALRVGSGDTSFADTFVVIYIPKTLDPKNAAAFNLFQGMRHPGKGMYAVETVQGLDDGMVRGGDRERMSDAGTASPLSAAASPRLSPRASPRAAVASPRSVVSVRSPRTAGGPTSSLSVRSPLRTLRQIKVCTDAALTQIVVKYFPHLRKGGTAVVATIRITYISPDISGFGDGRRELPAYEWLGAMRDVISLRRVPRRAIRAALEHARRAGIEVPDSMFERIVPWRIEMPSGEDLRIVRVTNDLDIADVKSLIADIDKRNRRAKQKGQCLIRVIEFGDKRIYFADAAEKTEAREQFESLRKKGIGLFKDNDKEHPLATPDPLFRDGVLPFSPEPPMSGPSSAAGTPEGRVHMISAAALAKKLEDAARRNSDGRKSPSALLRGFSRTKRAILRNIRNARVIASPNGLAQYIRQQGVHQYKHRNHIRRMIENAYRSIGFSPVFSNIRNVIMVMIDKRDSQTGIEIDEAVLSRGFERFGKRLHRALKYTMGKQEGKKRFTELMTYCAMQEQDERVFVRDHEDDEEYRGNRAQLLDDAQQYALQDGEGRAERNALVRMIPMIEDVQTIERALRDNTQEWNRQTMQRVADIFRTMREHWAVLTRRNVDEVHDEELLLFFPVVNEAYIRAAMENNGVDTTTQSMHPLMVAKNGMVVRVVMQRDANGRMGVRDVHIVAPPVLNVGRVRRKDAILIGIRDAIHMFCRCTYLEPTHIVLLLEALYRTYLHDETSIPDVRAMAAAA